MPHSPSFSHQKRQVNTLHKLALFVAWACVFQLIEFIFPSPFPGVRLGLANMISLVVLFQMGFRAALEIAILRVLISSVLVGTFLSPTFALSLAGAITSTLVMGILFKLSLKQDYLRLSLIGISIAGAITHTMTQLGLVYVILIKHTGIFLLTPWLLISALIMGSITGLIARQISKDMDGASIHFGRKEARRLIARTQQNKHDEHLTRSFLRKLSPTFKILYVCTMALLIVLIENMWLYGIVLVFTIILAFIGKIPSKKLWGGIKRMRFFLIMTIILDLLFVNQGATIIDWHGLHITQTGLSQGLLFACRLVILLLNSYIVSLSATPEEISLHLSRLLSPLKVFRFSPVRFAKIMMIAWMLVPTLLDQTYAYLKTSLTHFSALRHIASTLSRLILKSMESDAPQG